MSRHFEIGNRKMPSSKLRAMLPPLEGGSICFHAGPQSFVNLSHQILQADAARIAAAR